MYPDHDQKVFGTLLDAHYGKYTQIIASARKRCI